MSKKKVILFVLFLITILSFCLKPRKSSFQLFRLIDELKEENILASPLVQGLGQNEPQDKYYPAQSYPLTEWGVGPNPYGIKRKLKTGGAERNVLFAPPRSEFRFSPDIPSDSVLEFGLGIIRDENSEKLAIKSSAAHRGINFLVILEQGQRKKILFQKFINVPSLEKDPTWTFFRQVIPLPRSLKKAYLSLATEGEGKDFSFWSDPVIYQKGSQTHPVILISIDTLRADHLGCYGYQRDTSPNLDALAAEGAQFLNTYALSPWTLPSHVSLFTSLSGPSHQVYYESEKMDSSLITLADVLRRNHFLTSAFTGGGFVSAVYGFSKGFDSYYEGEGGVFRQDSSEQVFRVVSEWLDHNWEKNFFLFIHTYQPHNPYACPYPYKTMFLEEDARWGHLDLLEYLGGKTAIFRALPEKERQNIIALYDGEIRYTDEKLIGPVLEKLKSLGLYDRALVILTSDHGEEFFEHGGWLHGHSLYDESLKVPLIIKFPGSKFSGKKLSSIVSLLDIFPSVCAEMGIDVSGLDLDGKSLLPVLKEKERGDRLFFADLGDNVLDSRIPRKAAMNRGRKKLIFNKRFSPEDLAFFLFPPTVIQPAELYDLAQDPQEIKNIADKEAGLAAGLLRQIDEVYQKALKRQTGKAVIDEKLREQLRALGYIR